MSRIPPIDPDEILRHIVEHPDLYAADWDPDSMDLKDQLLDMKLKEAGEIGDSTAVTQEALSKPPA